MPISGHEKPFANLCVSALGGSTTETRTTTSTYSQRTTSTILRSTTSTSTTTSLYASSTFYAACGQNNLLWGINGFEINSLTNSGGWKSIVGFRSAYDCCVYGLKNNFGGAIFRTYTGDCMLAQPGSGVCNALTKTFVFNTGCPTYGSWIVSNGNCGQGTWAGKLAPSEFLTGPDSPPSIEASFQSAEQSPGDAETTLVWSEAPGDGPRFFDENAQEPIGITNTLFDESQQDQRGELKV